jgi:hypothetical protein
MITNAARTCLVSCLVVVPLLSLSAQAADVHPQHGKPLGSAMLAQKAPTSQTSGETFQTIREGLSGELVFANLDDLLILAAEVGAARMEVGNDGSPYIAGTIDGINYAIDVYNCDPVCADLSFTSSFTIDGLTNDQMNDWNASRRFGKAYIREDGDAVLQIAINTRYGITVETFRDDLVWWQTVLEDYVSFVGFR